MLFKSRKSQVSIFILIGLALFALLSLTIYFALSTQVIVDTQAIRRTPTSFRDYVEICMEEVSRIAIFNLGYQGGYIEVPQIIRADSDAFLKLESRGIFGIPAWYYRGRFRIPLLSDMELEISSVVEERLRICLDEFSGFRENYEVTEKGVLDVKTTISDDFVFVEAYYDIDVMAKSTGQIESYEIFTARHNVKLGKMHELGTRIVTSEVKNTNFEFALFDLMALNPNIPFTDMSFSIQPKEWKVADVQREIQEMIFYNFQNVRFKGTDYTPFQQSENFYEQFRGFNLVDYERGNIPSGKPDDAYHYFNLFFDPSDLPENYDKRYLDFSDIKVSTMYNPRDNFNVRIRPSTAGIMRTSMATFPGTSIPFPIQVGHFTYDINFIMEINLYDDTAFEGDGYVLRFGLPVVIKSNMPDKQTQGFHEIFEPSQFDNLCDDLEGSYRIQVIGLEYGMMDVPLNDVQLSYDCISFGCKLGTTRGESATFMLTTGLPSSCSGGFISAAKEGYLPAKKQHLGEEDIVIELKKLEVFGVDLVIRKSSDLTSSRSLGPGEYAIVKLLPKSVGEQSFVLINHTSEEFVELLADDGEYLVDVLLVDENNDRIIGGYKGIFVYEYADTFMKNNLVIDVVEYYPIPAPFTAETQFKIMEYIESGSYEQIEPRFR